MRVGAFISGNDIKLEISQLIGDSQINVSASLFAILSIKDKSFRSGCNFGINLLFAGSSLTKFFGSNTWDKSAYALYSLGPLGNLGLIAFVNHNKSRRYFGGGIKWTHFAGLNAVCGIHTTSQAPVTYLDISADFLVGYLNLNYGFSGPRKGGGFGFGCGF